MKRLAALLLALTLILGLTACADNPEPAPETGATESKKEPESGKETSTFKAAVFWYDYFDPYIGPLREKLGEYLTEAGITFENYDSENAQRTQDEQIDKAIKEGANLLIVNVVDTAWTDSALAICAKAKAVNIPVIFFQREVEDSVITSYSKACYVGSTAIERWRTQGQMAADYLLDNYDDADLNGDGRISYLLLWGGFSGPETGPMAIYSVNYCNVLLTAAGKPKLEYFDTASSDTFRITDWSKDGAYEIMKNILGKNPMDGDRPVELILTGSDDMALGCVEALNDAGWNTGEDPDKTIPVFGMDDTEDARAAVEEGRLTGTIRNPSAGIAETVTALVQNVQQGRSVLDGAEERFDLEGYHYLGFDEHGFFYEEPDWYKPKTRDEYVAKIRVPYETVIKED